MACTINARSRVGCSTERREGEWEKRRGGVTQREGGVRWRRGVEEEDVVKDRKKQRERESCDSCFFIV